MEFFAASSDAIDRRISSMFEAARDRQGRPLFPDHRSPGTPGYNLRRLLVEEVAHWHREATPPSAP